MTAETFLAFNLALLVAILSPGPALLVALQTALSSGRAAGIATTVGLGLVACLWTLAALLGLDAIFSAFPAAYGFVKAIGAAYLLWIAWKTWRAARATLGAGTATRGSAFRRGVMVNLTNPKSVLFSGAVLVVIFPAGLSGTEIAVIVLNHWAMCIAIYGAVVVIVTTAPARRRYLSLKPAFDRIAAVILGGLGLRLLADRA